MTTLGGWCQPAPGCTHTEREHVACRSKVCRCEAFGGHEKSPNQAQQSGSGRFETVNLHQQSGPDAELVPPAGPTDRTLRRVIG